MSGLDPSIYGTSYYAKHARDPLLMDSVTFGSAVGATLKPVSAVDFGCGVGAVLKGIYESGCHDILGFEHSDALRVILKNELNVIPSVDLHSWNLNDPILPGWSDVAISSEVAEHVSPVLGERLVRQVASMGRKVVWTAALPHQGGEGHINEQPPEYWEERFARHKYYVDRERTVRLRDELMGKIAGSFWYYNAFVYAPR